MYFSGAAAKRRFVFFENCRFPMAPPPHASRKRLSLVLLLDVSVLFSLPEEKILYFFIFASKIVSSLIVRAISLPSFPV